MDLSGKTGLSEITSEIVTKTYPLSTQVPPRPMQVGVDPLLAGGSTQISPAEEGSKDKEYS